MAYLVLARKWRPQRFDDIVGQSAIARTLANSIRLNRIGHAFLFSGPRGVGKTSTARILSKALNCVSGPTPEPCNVCQFCEEITRGASLDVIEIDGASNRGIDEIRDLRENVRYAPSSARFKIIIIDEVHMLTREAFNALLKTLEEPPAHAKFILATTEAHKVPITIVSRCQRYDFRRIDARTLAPALASICEREGIDVETRTLDILARAADGSFRDGLSLLDQVISFSGQTIVHDETMSLLGRIDPNLVWDILKAVADQDGKTALFRYDEFAQKGGDEAVLTRELMDACRDLMAVRVGATPRYDLPAGLAESFSVDQLERIFRILLDLETSLRSTEFPRLIMDVAIIKMSRIQSLIPIETLMSRLETALAGSSQTMTREPTTSTPTPSKPVAAVPSSIRQQIANEKPRSSQVASKPSAAMSIQTPPRPVEKAEAPSISVAPQPVTLIVEPAISPALKITGDRLQDILVNMPSDCAMLGACLAYGALAGETDSEIIIGFRTENRLHRERSESPENHAIIEATASRVVGRPMKVVLKEISGEMKSVAETRIEQEKKTSDANMKCALETPLISELMGRFDARIRDVRAAQANLQKDQEIVK